MRFITWCTGTHEICGTSRAWPMFVGLLTGPRMWGWEGRGQPLDVALLNPSNKRLVFLACQDEGDADFAEAYVAAMEAELRGTKMMESFERATAGPSPATAGATAPADRGIPDAAAADQEMPEAVAGAEGEQELLPVDVDMNLVKSLIQSYTSQQGLPGPASNLAGLLGFQLPDADD